MEEYCSFGDGQFDGSFLEFALSLPLIIIFQLFLLCLTIYSQYKRKNEDAFKQMSIKSRTLFIILQITGLCWTIVDLFTYVIDPLTLHKYIGGCLVLAYTPKILPLIYYSVYLYQIVIRIKLSFQNSYLELSSITIFVLYLFILIPLIITPIFFFILTTIENIVPCLHKWKPIDINPMGIDLSYCILPIPNGLIDIIIIAIILWILIGNITVGLMFSFKLNNILSNHNIYHNDQNTQNNNINFRLKSLIIKNSILTLIGSISSLLSYLLWLMMIIIGYIFGVIFLYIDLLINCIIIGLMFKYNEKYYKKLCKYCILMCFIDCDKSQQKIKEKDVMQYLDDSIDLDAIFMSTSDSHSTAPATTGTTGTTDTDNNRAANNNTGEPAINNKQAKSMMSIQDMISDVDRNYHVDDDDDSDKFLKNISGDIQFKLKCPSTSSYTDRNTPTSIKIELV